MPKTNPLNSGSLPKRLLVSASLKADDYRKVSSLAKDEDRTMSSATKFLIRLGLKKYSEIQDEIQKRLSK